MNKSAYFLKTFCAISLALMSLGSSFPAHAGSSTLTQDTCTIGISASSGDGSLSQFVGYSNKGSYCKYNILFSEAMTIKLNAPLSVNATGLFLTGEDVINHKPFGVVLDGSAMGPSRASGTSGGKISLIDPPCVVTVKDPANTVVDSLSIIVKEGGKPAICNPKGESILDPNSPAYNSHYDIEVLVVKPAPVPITCTDTDSDSLCDDKDADTDGVLNIDDLCPNEKGDVGSLKGCPSDTYCLNDQGDVEPKSSNHCATEPTTDDGDGDGILDADDACPAVAGDGSLKGCPADQYCEANDGQVVSKTDNDADTNGINDACEEDSALGGNPNPTLNVATGCSLNPTDAASISPMFTLFLLSGILPVMAYSTLLFRAHRSGIKK